MTGERPPGAATARGLAVFDIGTPAFWENRLIDLDYARKFPGAEAFARLAMALRAQGFDCVTADVYLGGHAVTGGPVLAVTQEGTAFTGRLLQDPRVMPAVCLSLESPIVARDFYRSISEVSRRFRHVFLWPGARSRATGGAVFHDISWPYPDLGSPTRGPAWANRRFLTMISSNKRVYAWPRGLVDPRHPRSSLRRLAGQLRTTALRYADPWLRTELYVDRLRAIEHFSAAADFDLYGRGWLEDASTLGAREGAAVRAAYRGEIDALGKLDTLAGYRFSLCYENTAFPGYITEKIFDCFAAGAVPVYLGAPDIGGAIPPSCYIDARRFPRLQDLERFLREMDEAAAESYREAAAGFVRSPAAARFRQERFVEELAAVLVECSDQADHERADADGG